jgi:hypothetical protein
VNAGAILGLSTNGTVGAVNSVGGTVFPGNGGTGVGNSGALTLDAASTFRAVLNSASAGFFSNLHVTGAVNLGGSTLNVTLGASTNPGDTFVIIDNDGADAVNGTFNGLPEGTLFNAGGFVLQITYVGGNGNDVVLTEISGVPTPTPPPPTPTTTPAGAPTPTPTGVPPVAAAVPTLSPLSWMLLALALAATGFALMRRSP